MQELVPLVSGFAVGLAFGAIRPSVQLWVGACLAVVLGVAATIVTGEFRTSWAFVLIDIPLVALAAFWGVVIARSLARRVAGAG